MSNVKQMPKRERSATPPAGKVGMHIAYIPGLPQAEENCLGQMRWIGEHFDQVEVFVFLDGIEVGRTGKPRRRRRIYVVDTMIEGARILYRVAGYPRAEIVQTSGGLRVTIAPVEAGSSAGPVRAA